MLNSDYVQSAHPFLEFISDEDYKECVLHLYNEYKRSVDDINIFYSEKGSERIPDPIGALVHSYFNPSISTYDDWENHEKARLAIKTLEMLIGEFHEIFIDKIDGWKKYDVGHGYDVRSDTKKIIADIKNKFNTEKGNKQFGVYETLEKKLNSFDEQYVAYYVTIIPNTANRRINKLFTPSHDGVNKPDNNRIKHVDGYTFYDLVTGREDSLKSIYDSLPQVIESIPMINADNNFSTKHNLHKVLFHNAFTKKILNTPQQEYLESIDTD